MLCHRRAKIVATMGPATQSRDALKCAIMSGMNVARLNFSHGTYEDHQKVIQIIRELSEELRAPVALLQDLQGPKIRVGKFEQDAIELKKGEIVTITTEDVIGKAGLIPSDFKRLHEVCTEGTRILMDDGLIELKVQKTNGKNITALVVYGGQLKNRKGMNIPGVFLPVEPMTEKDLKDLDFGLSKEVDYVALSFVRHENDIRKLREIIKSKNSSTRIIAKIEMIEALTHLEEIIKESDAIMVARGDLAIEVGQTQLPGIQKKIIRLCNKMGKPVITATQMLESMVEHAMPTRAEITDVANAILDGSDLLMLSAETASGKFPSKCIQTMHEIIIESEKTVSNYYHLSLEDEAFTLSQSIAASASLCALKHDAAAICCLTSTGRTANNISSFRPQCPIFAVTNHALALNKLELLWGVQTFTVNDFKTVEEAMEQIADQLVLYGIVKPGDKVVLTFGMPFPHSLDTNSMRIYTIDHRKVSPLLENDLPLRYKCKPWESIC